MAERDLSDELLEEEEEDKVMTSYSGVTVSSRYSISGISVQNSPTRAAILS